MKTKLFWAFIISICICNLKTQAQANINNEWTWIGGDSVINSPGIYGIKRQASPGNKPGARAGALTWTDHDGNFWLFGGYNTQGYFNDLWKYNPLTNECIWMKGDSVLNVYGINGIAGVPADNNKPGSRGYASGWIDKDNNLWLFGGLGYGTHIGNNGDQNDIWKYNIATNEWTWLKGDTTGQENPGFYGTRGIPSALNKPSDRQQGSAWADTLGNLWLFGGQISDGEAPGYLTKNDLWRYHIATNEWTWMKGDSIFRGPGVPGIISVPANTNNPPSTFGCAEWIDDSGDFWLLADALWKYYPYTNQWVRMKDGNSYSIYGTKGISSPQNTPGSREESISWKDNHGNLWLFGGTTVFPQNQPGLSNDLWKFDPISNEWMWINGDTTANISGDYGTRGVAAMSNKPGSRVVATSFTDLSGNPWIFGGYGRTNSGYGNLSDLWKFKFTVPPSLNIVTPADNATFFSYSNISFSVNASDTDGTITKVEFYYNGIKLGEDSTPPYSITANNVLAGHYTLVARATDNNGGTTISQPVHVSVVNTGCNGGGSISGEGYTNINGDQVADLISNPAYPNNPLVTASLTSFEYKNMGINYGARVRGYICAPVTGIYTFYIAADDQAGLWLSTDEDPAHKVLTAYTGNAVGLRQWYQNLSQKSIDISLVGGTRYYIETLHKQAISADHLSVAWVIPGIGFEGPIPGGRLSPIGSSSPNFQRGAEAFAQAMLSTDPVNGWQVVVSPNPSTTYFTISSKSKIDKSINMNLTDAYGRMVESKLNMSPNGTLQIGAKLPAGMYFMELTQGTEKKRIKLVKQ